MDAHLSRLKREAEIGDLEAMEEYIAALEEITAGLNPSIPRLLRRSMYALKPFAELEQDVDGSDAPWYLDDENIIYASKIFKQLRKFFGDN